MTKVWQMAVLAAILAAVIMYPSRERMTLTTDGVNYLTSAENIVRGRGAVNYTGQMELEHPPGYSYALAPFIKIGMNAQGAAFTVNWLSLIIVGVMAFMLLGDLTGKTDWRVTAGAVLVMANPPLVMYANQILSEALCAALVLSFLWLASRAAAATSKHWRWTVGTLLAGLALCFTRYPGLAVVLGVGLCMRTWRDRAIVTLPPLILGALAISVKVPSLFSINNGRPGMAWHVTDGISTIVTGTLGVALLVYLVVKNWHSITTRMMALQVLMYAGGLMASAMVFKIDPTLDLRLFTPISGVLYLMLIGLTIRHWRGFTSYVMAGLAYSLILGVVSFWPWLSTSSGKILNDPAFMDSRAMSMIDSIPPTTDIYSTCPAAIYLKTGRVTKALTNTLYRDKQEVRADKDDPRKTGGYLIWFKRFNNGYLGPESYQDIMVSYGEDKIAGYQDDVALIVPVMKAVVDSLSASWMLREIEKQTQVPRKAAQ